MFNFTEAMDNLYDAVFGTYDLDDFVSGSGEEDDIGSLLEWGSDGLQYTGSEVSEQPEMEPDEWEAPPILASAADAFHRSIQSYWQMLPVDEATSRSAQEVLDSLSDEELLQVPASVIVHLQRTSAAGGIQIVSPRQVTLGGIAGRVQEGRRQPDMHLVGSNATRGLPWPVAAGYILAGLWHNEPLDAYPNTPSVRSRTRQETVVVRGEQELGPVELAVVKSRALIDMQRRPDIGGDAEGLSEALAAAWGISPDLYYDVAGALVEGSGNLLRYAIGPDKHYPVVHAPIQARKVMSVAAMATGRDIYGEYAALDWRRMRVLAEAVFYMSARTEGYTMVDMAQMRPVGDPSAPVTRSGLMQFRPMPGSVWTFDPGTFRLQNVGSVRPTSGLILPERLSEILDSQLDSVRVRTMSGPAAARVTYASAQVPQTTSSVGEALIAGYELVTRTAAAFQAKGYTADSAAAGFIYNCMSGDRSGNAVEAVWITRSIADAARSLGLTHAVDARMARQAGARLRILTDDLRQKMVVEAEKHGSTLEEWWYDFGARLPMELRCATESNQSWACGIAWYLMAKPSPRWVRLSSALANESHRALASVHLASTTVAPAESVKRQMEEMLRVATARLSRSYGAYYHAVSDACYLLAGRMARGGATEESQVLRVAGRMWDIRAAATYTLGITMTDLGSSACGVVRGVDAEAVGWLKTSPYAAYAKWRETARAAQLDVAAYSEQVRGHVSDVFKNKTRPLADCFGMEGTRVMRYVERPARLYDDIESTLAEVTETLAGMVAHMQAGITDGGEQQARESAVPLSGGTLGISRYRAAEGSLWSVITELEQYDAVWVADMLDEMDTDVVARLEQRNYRDGGELLEEVRKEVAGARLSLGQEAVM